MASNIEHLARKFEAKLGVKTASRRGTQMNAKKIKKELEKARQTYKSHRAKLSTYESELAQLESKIKECRDGVKSSRSQMLRLNKVLQNMYLADTNKAMFYDNTEDVGYMIDGEEHYLERSDDGEISLTPWRERRKMLRQQRIDDGLSADDGDEDDADIPPSIADDEDYSADDNSADDGFFPHHPNLRFLD